MDHSTRDFDVTRAKLCNGAAYQGLTLVHFSAQPEQVPDTKCPLNTP